jgi:orotidine-5'-phosphate decarboxylase
MPPMHNPILVALDVPTQQQALELAERLAPVVGGFKVGSELFTAAGPEIVRRIRAFGVTVFLDLKLHDIPNTVARAVAAGVELDVQMLTVHTSGGPDMLRAAEQAARQTAERLLRPPPLLLGVTVLTSLDSRALSQVGQDDNVARQVQRLATLAKQCGLRGLVCSPLELVALRQVVGDDVVLVTPGIREGDSAADDQRRTLTARQAVEAGAHWLVIGRPIYGASDPRAAAERILASLPRR